MTQVGILHPGAMGAVLGARLVARGHAVQWVSAGRSDASRARAASGGLCDATSLRELTAASSVIVSVCPPEAALAVAEACALVGFAGLYVDVNAVAPSTARAIDAIVARSGAEAVDGGIVGPPPRVAGTTRLYLSGARAEEVEALFVETELEPRVLGAAIGAASALKAAYAAYTKGLSALLLGIRALARAEGVEDALLAEWTLSQPGLDALCSIAAANAAPKAWRFVGEMEQIAVAFAAAGLPDGFHRAAAEVYARLDGFKDASPAPELDAVVGELAR